MKYKSKVVKVFDSNSYQVKFSIDHQTFSLQPVEGDLEMSSEKLANWYKYQLDAAFKRILKHNKELKDTVKRQRDLLTLNEGI